MSRISFYESRISLYVSTYTYIVQFHIIYGIAQYASVYQFVSRTIGLNECVGDIFTGHSDWSRHSLRFLSSLLPFWLLPGLRVNP